MDLERTQCMSFVIIISKRRIAMIRELTSSTELHNYLPMQWSSVMGALSRYAPRNRPAVAEAVMQIQDYASQYYNIDKSTVFYIPSEIPSTKSIAHLNPERREKTINSFLSDCVNFTHDRSGGPNGRNKTPRVIVGSTKNFQNLKAKAKGILAGDLLSWLHHHPEVTNVIIADTVIALKLLPAYAKPRATAFKGMFMQVYTFELSGVDRDVTVSPNPTQLHKNEEKAYLLTSEIYEYLTDRRVRPTVHGTRIQDIASFNMAISTIRAFHKGEEEIPLAIDIETTGLNPVFEDQHILSCSFSDGTSTGTYKFLVDHPFAEEEGNNDGLDMLRLLVTIEGFILVLQNGKYDVKWIRHFLGIYPTSKLADTLLIDHYLNEGYGSLSKAMKVGILAMDSQVTRYLHYQSHKAEMAEVLRTARKRNDVSKVRARDYVTTKSIRDLIKSHKLPSIEPRSGQYANVPVDTLLSYNAEDAYSTANIYAEMITRVKEENGGEIPMVISYLHQRQMIVAAEMEYNGFPIDYREVSKEISECDDIIERSKIEMESVGLDFNPESNDQTLEYLKGRGYDLSIIKDEETGKYKLDSDRLKLLASREPWILPFLTMKRALKARNTYYIPFIQHSYKGVVYFSLNLHGTATGRLSSDSPNFQNIPKVIEAGDHDFYVKSVLRSSDDSTALFDADLKSAEVKVLTVYVKDKYLMERIKHGDDLHCYAASVMNPDVDYHEAEAAKIRSDEVKWAELTKREQYLLGKRGEAKSATFGTIYGIGPAGLAKQIHFEGNMTRKEKTQYALSLLTKLKTQAYPELNVYLETVIPQIEATGHTKTVFGRRRRFYRTQIKATFDFLESFVRDTHHVAAYSLYDNRTDFYINKRPVRQYLNTLVQSTTSDYFQDMIYELYTHGEKLGVKLYVTVHDSIVGSIPAEKGQGDKLVALLNNIVDKMPTVRYPELPVQIGVSCDFSTKYGSEGSGDLIDLLKKS